MKTISKLFSIITAVIFLTSCADKGSLKDEPSAELSETSSQSQISAAESGETSENNLIPITEIRENWAASVNAVKSKTFDNVSFSDAYFWFTDAQSVFDLEYARADFSQTPDEAFDFASRQVDALFPGLFTEAEKAEEIRIIGGGVRFDDKHIPYCFPSLEEYKEINPKEKCPSTGMCTKGVYLDTADGAVYGYTLGDFERLRDCGNSVYIFDTLKSFPIIYTTENIESDKVFHLSTGDVSIADAAISANKALAKLNISDRNIPVRPVVTAVDVLDIGNGNNAFSFSVVPEYKGIRFGCMLKDGTSVYGTTFLSDSTNETHNSGEASMCELGKISRYRQELASMAEIKETGEYTSIISLEEAAEKASKYLSREMRFKAMSVKPVYQGFSKEPAGGYASHEQMLNRNIKVHPCYMFTFKQTSGGDKRVYLIYVNMITGKTDVCVQRMTSDIEYE